MIILLPINVKNFGRKANSADPDQEEQYDLGLHCLLI